MLVELVVVVIMEVSLLVEMIGLQPNLVVVAGKQQTEGIVLVLDNYNLIVEN